MNHDLANTQQSKKYLLCHVTVHTGGTLEFI